MKVSIKVNDRVTVTAEAETPQELVKQLALLQEAFGEECCGKCQSKDIRFIHRTAKDDDGDVYDFYELRCNKCYAKLEYGQGKDTFYPKRMKTNKKGKAVKDENGKAIYLPDKGWLKFNKETGENE